MASYKASHPTRYRLPAQTRGRTTTFKRMRMAHTSQHPKDEWWWMNGETFSKSLKSSKSVCLKTGYFWNLLKSRGLPLFGGFLKWGSPKSSTLRFSIENDQAMEVPPWLWTPLFMKWQFSWLRYAIAPFSHRPSGHLGALPVQGKALREDRLLHHLRRQRMSTQCGSNPVVML